MVLQIFIIGNAFEFLCYLKSFYMCGRDVIGVAWQNSALSARVRVPSPAKK